MKTRNHLKKELIRYILVGGLNALTSFGVFSLFIHLHVHYTLAVLFSSIFSILFNFKTIGLFVFRNRNNWLIFKFFLVHSCLYLLNVSSLDVLQKLSFNSYNAEAVVLPAIGVMSYLLNKYFVFRASHESLLPKKCYDASSYKWPVFLALYSLAYGLMVFNPGWFWDDWTLYKTDVHAQWTSFSQGGQQGFFLIHLPFLYTEVNPLIYRLSIFLCYLFAAFCLNELLKCFKQYIDSTNRYFLVLFFALLPTNSARISLVTLTYAFNYFTFFLACLLLTKYLVNRKLHLRIITLALFLFSFITNSMLCFYLIALILIIYHYRGEVTVSVANATKKLITFADFLFLPIIFWVVKIKYFSPYGFLSDYNQVKTKDIAAFFLHSPSIMLELFCKIVNSAISYYYFSPLVIIMSSGLLYCFFTRSNPQPDQTNSTKQNIQFLILGLVLFFIALLPYFAVGSTPTLTDWTSRHELLIPLGISFILLSLTRLIIRQRAVFLCYSFLIVLFIVQSISTNINFYRDWIKQLSISEQMKTNPTFFQESTFIFADQATGLNSIQRKYRFYDYNGLMHYTFGDEKRLGMINSEFTDPIGYIEYIDNPFNMRDYHLSCPTHQVSIKPGNFFLSNTNLMRLLYWKLTNTKAYNSSLSQVVNLETQQITISKSKSDPKTTPCGSDFTVLSPDGNLDTVSNKERSL